MKNLPREQVIDLGMHAVSLLPLLFILQSATMTLLGFSTTLGFVASAGILAIAAQWGFTALLAMTPLHIVTGWRWPLRAKKPLALYTFAYAILHFIVFSGGFSFAPLATLIGSVSSAMLLTGTLALLLMIPLAATSTRWAMKKLGRNWKRLHYLTYVIAVFIVLHLIFLGVGLPWVILYSVLLGIRIPAVRKRIVAWRTGRQRRTFPTVSRMRNEVG